MKKTMKSLSALIAMTCLLFMTTSVLAGDGKPAGKPWACPDKDAKVESPVKPDAATLETGKAVWSQHCKSCHGKTGKGDGTKAETIEISCGDFTSDTYKKKSAGELFWKTSEGRKPMPSFKQKLSDVERWSVIMYTKTLN